MADLPDRYAIDYNLGGYLRYNIADNMSGVLNPRGRVAEQSHGYSQFIFSSSGTEQSFRFGDGVLSGTDGDIYRYSDDETIISKLNTLVTGSGSLTSGTISNFISDDGEYKLVNIAGRQIVKSTPEYYEIATYDSDFSDKLAGIKLQSGTITISGTLVSIVSSGTSESFDLITMVDQDSPAVANVTLQNNGGELTVAGDMDITGDFTVAGTTYLQSVITEITDPILLLGAGTSASHTTDRGIEFKYYNGSVKSGFFGYNQDNERFVYLLDATNNSETITGTLGNIDVGGIYVGGTQKDSNWDTAYSWGDHSTAGYAASSHSHSIAHSSLTGIGTSDHHTRYTDTEAIDAIESLSIQSATSSDYVIFSGSSGLGKIAFSSLDENTLTAIKTYVDTAFSGSDTFGELTDVSVTPNENDFVVYSGSNWVDRTPAQVKDILGLGSTSSPTFDDVTITGTVTLSGDAIINETNGTNDLTFQVGGTDIFTVTSDGIVMSEIGGEQLDIEAGEFIGDLRGAIEFQAQVDETGGIDKGEVVYINGISGNTLTVGTADNNNTSRMPAFGIAAETSSNNSAITIYTFGTLTGLDTDPAGETWSEGDALYVADNRGELTNVKPSSENKQIQKIARVTKVHDTTGSIFIMGAGRSNATPNLDDGNIFLGNASDYAVATTLDTSIVPENTNLYYTDARVDSHLSGGTGVTYSAGTISIGQDVATTSDVTFNSLTLSKTATAPLNIATSGGFEINFTGTSSANIYNASGSMFLLTGSGQKTAIGSNGTNNLLIVDTDEDVYITNNLRVTKDIVVGSQGLESWSTNYAAIEIGGTSIMGRDSATSDKDMYITSNAYFDGAWKYKTAEDTTQVYLLNRGFYMRSAATGTADATVDYTTDGIAGIERGHRFTVDRDGLAYLNNQNAGTSAKLRLGVGGDTANHLEIDNNGDITIANNLTVNERIKSYGNGGRPFEWGDTGAVGFLSFDSNSNALIGNVSTNDVIFSTNNNVTEFFRLDHSAGEILIKKAITTTLTGNVTFIDANNSNIIGVNLLQIDDPGDTEGIQFTGNETAGDYILAVSDDGVGDVTFNLKGNHSSDLTFLINNAGTGEFNLDVNGDADISGNITVGGTVDGVDIAARDHDAYTDTDAVDAIEAVGTATPVSTDTLVFSDAGVLKRVAFADLDNSILTGISSGGGIEASESAVDLASGWYTIAQNTGDRAIARFAIRDTNSGDHQAMVFYATHHFGTDGSNSITVLANSYYSDPPITQIRIKDGGTYDGAALQVYVDNNLDNNLVVYLLDTNIQSSGWVIVDWLTDSSAPSLVSNWSSFTEKAKVTLTQLPEDGIITTGEIYGGGATTQYQYLNTADVDDTAVDGATTAPISSNWAFDHDASASAHHTKYAITEDSTSNVTFNNLVLGAQGLESWNSNYAAIEIGGTSIMGKDLASGDKDMYISTNAYFDNTWKRKTAEDTSQFYLLNREFVFRSSASSTADSSITWDTHAKIGSTSTFYGDVTVTKSSGDTTFIIEADSDNDVETDNVALELYQDGRIVYLKQGIDSDNNSYQNYYQALLFQKQGTTKASFGDNLIFYDDVYTYFGTNSDARIGWVSATNTLDFRSNGDITFTLDDNNDSANGFRINNGGDTTIFTVDESGNITNATWNGNVIASAYLDSDTAHLSTAQTFSGNKTFSGDIYASNGIYGAATGAPDSRIWAVSAQYNNWGIFYNEGTPDLIEFQAGGVVKASIELDNGNFNVNDITLGGSIRSNANVTIHLDDNADGDNVFRIRNSGDTSIFEVDESGNVTVNGNVDGVDIASFKTSYDSHSHAGDIEGVTAGAGLTGGGTTGSVTLDIGAGTGITVNADDIQISSTYAGQSSITTLGTIATGTWNGSVIASQYLDSDTAHLSGAQTFGGEKTFSSVINAEDGINKASGNLEFKIGGGWKFRVFDGGVTVGGGRIDAVNQLNFNTVTSTIAGIQNQNLLDKTAAETITGVYTFNGSDAMVAKQASADIQIKLERTSSSAGWMGIGANSAGFQLYNSSIQKQMQISQSGVITLATWQGVAIDSAYIDDGSGSGLDADLLDGNHASAFALSGHTHTAVSMNESYTDIGVSGHTAQSSLTVTTAPTDARVYVDGVKMRPNTNSTSWDYDFYRPSTTTIQFTADLPSGSVVAMEWIA